MDGSHHLVHDLYDFALSDLPDVHDTSSHTLQQWPAPLDQCLVSTNHDGQRTLFGRRSSAAHGSIQNETTLRSDGFIDLSHRQSGPARHLNQHFALGESVHESCIPKDDFL